ncbi:hypothetical protein A464_plas0118 (plasmid) [Salmonella bongori N268-08]|uniref:Uncharacterized protein n=1 Tax=Salmonella bongori N268-08 TaxID=1197719 RepID=S5NNZ6_SALBN|nr:hypothetical protein A464_plas0118 [Salmonella bongori N268-08]
MDTLNPDCPEQPVLYYKKKRFNLANTGKPLKHCASRTKKCVRDCLICLHQPKHTLQKYRT